MPPPDQAQWFAEEVQPHEPTLGRDLPNGFRHQAPRRFILTASFEL